jgi:hypothetical protein
MILPVLLLTAWFVYVEVEMPNRTNECPYNEYMCEVEEVEDDES